MIGYTVYMNGGGNGVNKDAERNQNKGIWLREVNFETGDGREKFESASSILKYWRKDLARRFGVLDGN